MNQANYITHVELENPNLQPEISVYLYATTNILVVVIKLLYKPILILIMQLGTINHQLI